MTTKASAISVELVTPLVGAVIGGVDLQEPLDGESVRFLRELLVDHGVLFFGDQDITRDQLLAFASAFGTPIPEPFATPSADLGIVGEANTAPNKRATDKWHSDTTFVPEPPMATVLRTVRVPRVGGDTCWGNMYAAYDALSAPMCEMLDGLTAVHSALPVLESMGAATATAIQFVEEKHGLENIHPVVRVHPDTGRKALFVNEAATTRIVELTPAESAHVLALLFEHVKSPDFTMRHRWAANDVALWDNRVVQHYAVPDYEYEDERLIQRLVVAGDRPYGPK